MPDTTNGLSNSDRKSLFIQAAQSMGTEQFTKAVATAAIVPIAQQVIEQAKFRQLLMIDRFDGIAIPYTLKKRNTAVYMQKYGQAPSFIQRYTKVLIEPWLLAINPEISVLDIRDANFNVVSDILDDAGKEISVLEDQAGFDIWDAASPIPGSAWSGVTSDEWPTVSAGPGDIGTILSTNVVRLKNGDTPVAQDVIKLQSYLRMIGYEADGLIMNPYSLGGLMATNEFLLYLNFGARDVMERGYLENALGVKMVTSRLCPQRTIWAQDTAEIGRFCEKDPLTVETKVEKLMSSWFLWERIAIFIRNANAMIRLAYNEA